MKLAVVIVSYNTKELLKNCLRSIYEKKWTNNIEVVVVDNGSTDGSGEMVKHDFPKVKFIQQGYNSGFTVANNAGIKSVDADYYLLLNSDTEVFEGSLDKLVKFASEGNYGVASCELVYADDSFQANAGELPTLFPMFAWLSGLDDILGKLFVFSSYQARDPRYYQKDREVGWVSGAAELISRKVISKIGILDENIFMYGDDVEYCLRAKKAGFKVGWTRQAKIMHLGGKSWSSPKYNQWKGEFKGLLYIYRKFYGNLAAFGLRILIYIFTLIRSAAFLILGKFEFSRTYAKVIFNI